MSSPPKSLECQRLRRRELSSWTGLVVLALGLEIVLVSNCSDSLGFEYNAPSSSRGSDAATAPAPQPPPRAGARPAASDAGPAPRASGSNDQNSGDDPDDDPDGVAGIDGGPGSSRSGQDEDAGQRGGQEPPPPPPAQPALTRLAPADVACQGSAFGGGDQLGIECDQDGNCDCLVNGELVANCIDDNDQPNCSVSASGSGNVAGCCPR